MKWPWLLLEAEEDREVRADKNFSRKFKSAETYLREQFPEAQIPSSLLKAALRDSHDPSQTSIDTYQGELLAAGITKYHRERGKGRLFFAFPSGEMRTQISMSKSALADNSCCNCQIF
jgi:hypothetical protein